MDHPPNALKGQLLDMSAGVGTRRLCQWFPVKAAEDSMFPRVSGLFYPQFWHCFVVSYQKQTKPASFTAEANWEHLETQIASDSERVKIWHRGWLNLRTPKIGKH